MYAIEWMVVVRRGMLAVCLIPLAAIADEGRAPLFPAQVNSKWRQECSSCHIAYAPGLLPAESWRRVMGGLDKHFGTDASMTPADTGEISAYLVKYGNSRWSGSATPLRITETAGFKRQHGGRQFAAGVWTRPSVKSASNCQACHAGADKGDFDEASVKIPN